MDTLLILALIIGGAAVIVWFSRRDR